MTGANCEQGLCLEAIEQGGAEFENGDTENNQREDESLQKRLLETRMPHGRSAKA